MSIAVIAEGTKQEKQWFEQLITLRVTLRVAISKMSAKSQQLLKFPAKF